MRRTLAAVSIVVLASSPARAAELAGDWVHPYEGGEAVLSLRADGTFAWEGMKGKWKSSPGKLSLAADTGESFDYDLVLDGDKLTLSGGDLGKKSFAYTRRASQPAAPAKPAPSPVAPSPAPSPSPASTSPDGNAQKPEEPVTELSRKPQDVPRDAKAWKPRFTSETHVVKTETFEVTLPTSWTFQSGEQGGAKILSVNPGLAATDTLRQQIIFWVKPCPLAEIELGFRARVEKNKTGADQLFKGNGLDLDQKKLEILDAPGGLIARADYAGTLTNQFVKGQKTTGLLAVTQRKMYDVAVTIITLEGNAKDSTDDALAVLDSCKCFLKDRDAELEKKIVGTWVVPSKTGVTFETYDFFENGTYKWHYEMSQTGAVKELGGDTKATWGVASQSDETGRYEIRGDVIFFVCAGKGEQGLHVAEGVDGKGRRALTIGRKTFIR